MYAVIRRAKTNPGMTGQVSQRVKEGYLPIIKEIPGFIAFYLVENEGDIVATISIFNDREGAEESTKQAATWIRENLVDLMPAANTQTPFEAIYGNVSISS